MTISEIQDPYCIRLLPNLRSASDSTVKLAFLSDGDNQTLVSFGNTETRVLNSEIPMEKILTLDLPTKSQRVFSVRNRPGEVFVSCVGGTSVLQTDGAELIEMNDTSVISTESSLYVGDVGHESIVQVTKSHARLISLNSYTDYRANGKIVSGISKDNILIFLFDEDLSRRILLLSSTLEELTSYTVEEDVTGMGFLSENRIVVSLSNTILILSKDMSLISRHVLSNILISSVLVDSAEIHIGTRDGLVLKFDACMSLSENMIGTESVQLVKTGDSVLAFTRRSIVKSDRIINLKGIESLCECKNLLFTVNREGKLEIFFFTHFFPTLPPLSPLQVCSGKDCLLLCTDNVSVFKPTGEVGKFDITWKYALVREEKIWAANYQNEISLWHKNIECIWEKPIHDTVLSFLVFNQFLLVCGKSHLHVFSNLKNEIPIFLSFIVNEGFDKIISFSDTEFILASPTSVASATLSCDDKIVFTSVSENQNLQISEICVLNPNSIVSGSLDGRIRIHRLPDIRDTESEICMNANYIVSEFQVSRNPITSLLHCGDSRNFVYFAAGNDIGVLALRDIPNSILWK